MGPWCTITTDHFSGYWPLQWLLTISFTYSNQFTLRVCVRVWTVTFESGDLCPTHWSILTPSRSCTDLQVIGQSSRSRETNKSLATVGTADQWQWLKAGLNWKLKVINNQSVRNSLIEPLPQSAKNMTSPQVRAFYSNTGGRSVRDAPPLHLITPCHIIWNVPVYQLSNWCILVVTVSWW